MVDPVKAQYEAYPYPERDPADEAKRLVEGSPSHPVEIDHFLFGGRRDWTRPFRALVAGGGTVEPGDTIDVRVVHAPSNGILAAVELTARR
jgi:hypothetical protein